jgi:hypothetical protein
VADNSGSGLMRLNGSLNQPNRSPAVRHPSCFSMIADSRSLSVASLVVEKNASVLALGLGGKVAISMPH